MRVLPAVSMVVHSSCRRECSGIPPRGLARSWFPFIHELCSEAAKPFSRELPAALLIWQPSGYRGLVSLATDGRRRRAWRRVDCLAFRWRVFCHPRSVNCGLPRFPGRRPSWRTKCRVGRRSTRSAVRRGRISVPGEGRTRAFFPLPRECRSTGRYFSGYNNGLGVS